MPTREEIEAVMRNHVRCDATGLAPAVASVFLSGIPEAAAEIVGLLGVPLSGSGSQASPEAPTDPRPTGVDPSRGWQPIDTAPQTDEDILVSATCWDDDGKPTRYVTISSYEDQPWRRGFRHRNGARGVTHWQPMPVPTADVGFDPYTGFGDEPPAQAIEARRAEMRSSSVEDESAIAESNAPNTPPPPRLNPQEKPDG